MLVLASEPQLVPKPSFLLALAGEGQFHRIQLW